MLEKDNNWTLVESGRLYGLNRTGWSFSGSISGSIIGDYLCTEAKECHAVNYGAILISVSLYDYNCFSVLLIYYVSQMQFILFL